MAKSIIIQIQEDALNSDILTSDIARKAYAVARKLEIKGFIDFLYKEVNGYSSKDKIPDYREVRCQLKALNPFVGNWMPVLLNSDDIRDRLCKKKVPDSISRLEKLAEGDEAISLQIPCHPSTNLSLAQNTDLNTEYSLFFGKDIVYGILQNIRNSILDWAIDLEKQGITGDGIMFNEKEKEIAQTINYTTNIYGNNGNQQIQQGTSYSSQNMNVNSIDVQKIEEFILQLEGNMEQLNLKEENVKLVNDKINEIKKETEKETPKKSMITKALSTIRSILEGVAGSLAASGLIYMITQI